MSNDTALRRLGFRVLGAAVLAGLSYTLSLGPICWSMAWLQWEQQFPRIGYAVSSVYSPLAPAIIDGPEPVRRVLKWWLAVGMPARTEFHDDWPRGVGWSNPGWCYTLWHY